MSIQIPSLSFHQSNSNNYNNNFVPYQKNHTTSDSQNDI